MKHLWPQPLSGFRDTVIEHPAGALRKQDETGQLDSRAWAGVHHLLGSRSRKAPPEAL